MSSLSKKAQRARGRFARAQRIIEAVEWLILAIVGGWLLMWAVGWV